MKALVLFAILIPICISNAQNGSINWQEFQKQWDADEVGITQKLDVKHGQALRDASGLTEGEIRDITPQNGNVCRSRERINSLSYLEGVFPPKKVSCPDECKQKCTKECELSGDSGLFGISQETWNIGLAILALVGILF